MIDNAGRPFRWEELDQRLIRPKTDDLSKEMHERAEEGERAIQAEALKSGSIAGCFSPLV